MPDYLLIDSRHQASLHAPSDEELEWLREDLDSWFTVNRRRFPWRESGTSLYEHVITEILLQHTRAEKVARVFSLFFKKFPSWAALANAEVPEIEDVIRPLGLWRRRAAYIHELATAIVAKHGKVPDSYGQLRQLPGVGHYVANAILVFQCASKEPLLDRGMARVVIRLFDLSVQSDICGDPVLRELAGRIVDCERSIEISWA